MPLTSAENVTVGHKVMLHGCTIGDESLIGIGAVVLNGAKIGKNCLVGAGALVTEGKEFPGRQHDRRRAGARGAPAHARADRGPASERRALHRQRAALPAAGLKRLGLRPHLPAMSELHKFIFDGLPVRGMLVRLTDAWQEVLRRRAANTQTGAWPPPVAEMLGEMTAAAVLMQSNIKFDGALIMQIFGDGPVKLAVAEVHPDLRLRATASVMGRWRRACACPRWSTCTARAAAPSRSTPSDQRPGPAALPGRGAAGRRPGGAPLQSAGRRAGALHAASPSSSTPPWCWPPTSRWPPAC
jgi:hypothetical protein